LANVHLDLTNAEQAELVSPSTSILRKLTLFI